MVKAAASLGYTVRPEELERAAADLEKLDDDELEAAGGKGFRKEKKTDEHGRLEWCVAAWHCFVATLHSETESTDVTCWKDHRCILVNKGVKIV